MWVKARGFTSVLPLTNGSHECFVAYWRRYSHRQVHNAHPFTKAKNMQGRFENGPGARQLCRFGIQTVFYGEAA